MGGIIIIIAIVVPTLLCAKLTNIYVILMLVTTIWLGALGFADDYIKVFRKNKEGTSTESLSNHRTGRTWSDCRSDALPQS